MHAIYARPLRYASLSTQSVTKPIPPGSARGCDGGDPAGRLPPKRPPATATSFAGVRAARVCTGYGSADRGHEAEADPAAAVNEPHAGGLRFLGGMVIPWTGQGEAVTTTPADGSVMGAADGSSPSRSRGARRGSQA